jgi:ketosteroid isomerase-like protein
MTPGVDTSGANDAVYTDAIWPDQRSVARHAGHDVVDVLVAELPPGAQMLWGTSTVVVVTGTAVLVVVVATGGAT